MRRSRDIHSRLPVVLLATTVVLAISLGAAACQPRQRPASSPRSALGSATPRLVVGIIATQNAGYFPEEGGTKWSATLFEAGPHPWSYARIQLQGADDMVVVTPNGTQVSRPSAGSGEETLAIGPVRIEGGGVSNVGSLVVKRLTMLKDAGFTLPDLSAAPAVPPSSGGERWTVTDRAWLPAKSSAATRPVWVTIEGASGGDLNPQTVQYAPVDKATQFADLAGRPDPVGELSYNGHDRPGRDVRATLERRGGAVYATKVEVLP